MTHGFVIAWGDGDADALLRSVAADLLGEPVASITVTRACPRCGSADHGRPVVVGRRDVHVSLSRAGGTCVVAATTLGPIGVDVERVGAAGPDGAATRAWVREEAWRKADGAGITGEPDRDAAHWCDDLEAPEGFVAAVCVLPLS